MFRDDGQRNRVCLALLRSVRRDSLWTDKGPTVRATELRKQDGGPLVAAERAMLLLAFEVWDQDTGLRISELMRLGGHGLELAGTLLAALTGGASAVDAWLERHDAPAGAPTVRLRTNPPPRS